MRPPIRRGGLLGLFDRHTERQARQLSKKQARKNKRQIEDGETTGVHDSGGLMSTDELTDAKLLEPDGPYLGIDEAGEHFVFYNGTGSLATFGNPGIGKGATVGQPNQGHLGNDYSIICVDVGAENYRVSAEYRAEELGQEVVAYNPSGLYDIPGVNLDPLAHIREAGRKGDFSRLIRYAKQFVNVLIPKKHDKGADNSWVDDGARFELETRIVFTAWEYTALCTLPALYEFLSEPPARQLELMLTRSVHDYVLTRIRQMEADLETGADKQLHWKLEKAASALEPFSRHSELGMALSGKPFDPSIMKREPVTLFLQIPESTLKAYGTGLALQITSLVEQLAEAEGDQKIIFIIDEASQLPAMDLPMWIRSLRKRGIQFWTFWQSIASVEEVYGRAGAVDLLASCDLKQYLSIDDVTHARRLSERAGTTTILGVSNSTGGDGISAQSSSSEKSISTLPVADILNLPRHQQLIELNGHKLIRGLRVPWWEIEPFCDRLKTFSEMDDTPRYAPSSGRDIDQSENEQ